VAFAAAKGLSLTGYRDSKRRCLLSAAALLIGGLMSSRERVAEPGRVRLNEEDVAYVMNLLRNATQPVNTQQLIDVLRRYPGQFQNASASADSSDEAQD